MRGLDLLAALKGGMRTGHQKDADHDLWLARLSNVPDTFKFSDYSPANQDLKSTALSGHLQKMEHHGYITSVKYGRYKVYTKTYKCKE